MNWKPRKLWFNVHLYLGLIVGLLFALLGLTGSVLVFDHAIDEWMNPHLLKSQNDGTPRPLSAIAAAAAEACPDLPGPRFLMPPRIPDGVYLASFTDLSDPDHPRTVEVAVDPATGRVLGRRVWGEYLTSWIYKLHYTLLLRGVGETVVGVVGILLMISVGSGIYLWWPILVKGGARRAFGLKRSHLNFDLHKLVGLGSGLVLCVIAFTGAYMVFPEWFKTPVTAFSAETPFPTGLQSEPRSDGAAIDADEAVAIARRIFPEAAFKGIQLPTEPEGVYAVALRKPGEVRRTWGGCTVWIDQYSGEVLEAHDSAERTAADTFIAWQFPLHNGEAFGLAGRWVVCVTGLTPAALYVTGVLLWWRKRRSRRRQQARKAQRSAPPALASGAAN